MLLRSMRSKNGESVPARLIVRAKREGGGRIQSRLGVKALRKRRQSSVGDVEIDTLDTMHGEENDRGSERLTLLDHRGNIFE